LKRFAQLSKVLPVMPVFGGGTTRFQPVFVGDIARVIEIISRHNIAMSEFVDGKTIEAGGPDGKFPIIMIRVEMSERINYCSVHLPRDHGTGLEIHRQTQTNHLRAIRSWQRPGFDL
jgi:hypothetical protein